MVNLWSSTKVSVPQLMGEVTAPPAGANDLGAIMAHADALDREREERAAAEADGWEERFDDVDLFSIAAEEGAP